MKWKENDACNLKSVVCAFTFRLMSTVDFHWSCSCTCFGVRLHQPCTCKTFLPVFHSTVALPYVCLIKSTLINIFVLQKSLTSAWCCHLHVSLWAKELAKKFNFVLVLKDRTMYMLLSRRHICQLCFLFAATLSFFYLKAIKRSINWM